MKKIGLGQTIQILANVGVIAGIVFLALELRQNSELMRSQSRTAMAQGTIELLTKEIGNADFIDAMNRANNGEDITDLEDSQFRRLQHGWVWHWNNLAYQHRIGLYDDSEFALQMKVVREDMVRYPGMKRLWCESGRREASPETISAIEGNGGDGFCP